MKTAKVVGIFTLAICLPYVIGYVHGYNNGLDIGAERTETIYTKLLQEASQPRPAQVLLIYMSWRSGYQYLLCNTGTGTDKDSLQFIPIKDLTGSIITSEVCSKIEHTIEAQKGEHKDASEERILSGH